MSKVPKPEHGLELLYALAEAGLFGPNPVVPRAVLAEAMGCTVGNLYMLEQSIFKRLRRKPEIWKLRERTTL